MDRVMEPIGEAALEAIAAELRNRIREHLEPFEEVFCLNDCADYVSESNWDKIWSKCPAWRLKAWMLADNGRHARGEMARMTVGEIKAAYDDPGFYPERSSYTEADEEGLF